MKKFLSGFVALFSILILSACNGASNANKTQDSKAKSETPATNTNAPKKDNKEDSDPKLLKNHEKYAKLALFSGAENAKVIGEKDYKASWTDDSWAGVKISIDNISILKLSDFKNITKQELQGYIIIHFIIESTKRDVNINPEYASLNTNTGEQTKGSYEMDSFAGGLMKGSKVDGYTTFPLKKIEDVNAINQLRLKFNSNYETKDYSDENSRHEYDITIDLN